MLLEAERWEMHTSSKHESLGQNADTTNTVDLHLHVRVTVGVAEVSQMRSPGGILCIALDNDGVFVQRVSQSQGRFRFLPRVQVVGLFSAQPIGKWPPNIWNS